MPRSDARERLARELGLVTLETAAEQTGASLPLLRRWVRTGQLPVFLVGRELFLCPELVAEIARASPRSEGGA